jgi:hypothetical protein
MAEIELRHIEKSYDSAGMRQRQAEQVEAAA